MRRAESSEKLRKAQKSAIIVALAFSRFLTRFLALFTFSLSGADTTKLETSFGGINVSRGEMKTRVNFCDLHLESYPIASTASHALLNSK